MQNQKATQNAKPKNLRFSAFCMIMYEGFYRKIILHIYMKKLISVILIFIILINTIGIDSSFAKGLRDQDNTQSSTYPSANDIIGNATTTDAGYIPADAPVINAQAAIVMDLDTGDVLYEKSAHQTMYPASITKVLTCLLAIENGNVNDIITVSESDMSQVEEGSSAIGLQAGEQLTLKDALYGMMLNSGNECALAIADYISGSSDQFAELMNKTARSLGCTDSHFVNPNGLHNSDHYTTCYDMALIGKAAYQYPEFKKLISSQSYTIPETNLNVERPLWQENRLIYSGNGEYYYQYCTGGKTGYTLDADATLISFAEKDGKRLVTVVMKCNPTTESYLDTIKLDEFCFDKYVLYKPFIDSEYKFQVPEDSDILTNFYNDLEHQDIQYYYDNSKCIYIRSFISHDEFAVRSEFYDKIENDVRGRLVVSYNGTDILETPLMVKKPYIDASSTDAIRNNTPDKEPEIDYIKWIKRSIIIFIVLIILLLMIILFVKARRRLQYYNSKRSVRYYPISKDAKLNKKKEAANKKEDQNDSNKEGIKDNNKEKINDLNKEEIKEDKKDRKDKKTSKTVVNDTSSFKRLKKAEEMADEFTEADDGIFED